MNVAKPQGTIYVGNAGPIPVFVHWSAVFMVFLAFRGGDDLSVGVAVLLALVVGIVLHEFGHGFTALVFKARNISVTLWAIGGVCASERDREARPWAEVAILVAGPAVSFALAGLSYVLGWVLAGAMPDLLVEGGQLAAFLAQGGDPKQVTGLLRDNYPMISLSELSMWGVTLTMMFWVNLSLGIFNCLPIFPLDGGQIAYQVQRGCGVRHNTAAIVGRVLAVAGGAGGLGFAYWYFGSVSTFNLIFVAILVVMSFQYLRVR
jgi:Zn-dependent protease